MAHIIPLPPLRIGRVTLTVRNLDGVADFYRTALGLELIARDGATAALGAGAVPLLELRRDNAARRGERGEAGLFHTAFLLPSRGDLGRWLAQAAESGIRLQGAADHGDPPPASDWGLLISIGKNYLKWPSLVYAPALATVATVLSVNWISRWLRNTD